MTLFPFMIVSMTRKIHDEHQYNNINEEKAEKTIDSGVVIVLVLTGGNSMIAAG
jgi:hypothetical protein